MLGKPADNSMGKTYRLSYILEPHLHSSNHEVIDLVPMMPCKSQIKIVSIVAEISIVTFTSLFLLCMILFQ